MTARTFCNTHLYKTPRQQANSMDQASSSTWTSRTTHLANHLLPYAGGDSPFFGLSPDNIHSLLNIISMNNPLAHLAIQEALARSETFAPRDTQEALPLFFRAKTTHQLPPIDEIFFGLNLKHQTSQALIGIIDRHLLPLIQNTLPLIQQNLEPLSKLLNLTHGLLAHPASNNRQFWKYLLNPEVTRSLTALLETAQRYHTIGALPRQEPNTTALNTLKAAVEKLETLKEILVYQTVNIPDNSPLFQDKDVVLALVENFSGYLENASLELQNDPEVLFAAVRSDNEAFFHASAELQTNPDIALSVVQQNGMALTFMSEDFQANPSIVFSAVQQNGEALEFASPALQNNASIVLAAVQQNGNALEFASEQLQNNADIVLAAVQQNGEALEFASEQLQNNADIVRAALQQNGSALEFASPAQQANPALVQIALSHNGSNIQFASEHLRANPSLAMMAVKQSGWALRHVHEDLRNNRQLVLAAVQTDSAAFLFSGETCRADKEIVLNAMLSVGDIDTYVLLDNPETNALVTPALLLSHASLELQADPELRAIANQ
jgi:Domain of unknown function (DUF4116)